jgi:hypothetical protein
MDRSNQPQPSLDVVADDLLFADNRPRGEGGDFGGGSDFEAAPGSSSPPARSAPPVRRAPPPTDEAADLEDLPF